MPRASPTNVPRRAPATASFRCPALVPMTVRLQPNRAAVGHTRPWSGSSITSVINGVTWVRSEVMQVLGDLPVRDPGAVALDLEALDREEGLDDLRAERPAQDRVALERLEGCVQRFGKCSADYLAVRPVCITVDGRWRAQTLLHSVRTGGQHRRDRQIRVRGAVGGPDLDPRRAAALRRDA